MSQKPALSLAAMPGRRRATLQLAQEIERRGFSGIYCPSFADGIGLCEALALSTKTIRFGTAIANIYTRHPFDYAQTAALIHELSGGRFLFGIGVSHGPVHARLGVTAGKPLADVRHFVEQLREGGKRQGELPPVVLATLRKPMVRLAAEIAQGAVWANASRSHMAQSLSCVPAEKRRSDDFFIGNMIPTCISDDRASAAAVMRKTLLGYVMLPNYQNYWIEAGYVEEMRAIQGAIDAKETDRIASLMSDQWLSDVTLFGTVGEVREGIEAWFAAGVSTPILVPSSTAGGQMKAFEELLGALA
jgi:alkanesulfonate monooxygenase SsuD/methylene tetrahydromethanopterin reductase-like flavin-dependent oxidoreductase (luciferase family)